MECYILAGGKSKRFGEDKLLYPIKGKRTVEYVIESLAKVCGKLFLVAKEKEKFRDLDVDVVLDELPFFASIVGVYSALKNTKESKVIIVSGDTPLIRPEVINFLILNSDEAEITVFRSKERIYPFPGVYSKELLPKVESMVNKRNFKLMELIKGAKTKFIDVQTIEDIDPRGDTFVNMNTKEDLREIIMRIESKF